MFSTVSSSGDLPRVSVGGLFSLREVFLSSQGDLLRYLTRKVGATDAPDLLQETFVRVVRLEKPERINDPPAFLKTIATNLARDFVRRRRTEANYIQFSDYLVEAPSADAPADERVDYERKSRLLDAAVSSLPPRCREVFKLHTYEDVPLQEIARRLEISDRMVRKHLSLAFRTCRAALRDSLE
ncbi:RNA polymerase sigma factor [Methylocystis sp. MJC1]|uniref:RNA polymerase sigma factor n=1 Tax=Methylocystis sp. MJC1 TaxID=2654282 RepID=UPI0013EDE175|nr:RNA polymerase sigma factor [Methylocystis sp. MJC1]KAF2989907.1 putative RNA polymerase sigma factor FecI [Methylocystis sp. MJC1]MBU6528325.1 RNA polymerase sigma factor [Methylocystis sp. MJC1]UZX11230.1 RNA polymerase sigma factor [Methylocystis sp. MJC1]